MKKASEVVDHHTVVSVYLIGIQGNNIMFSPKFINYLLLYIYLILLGVISMTTVYFFALHIRNRCWIFERQVGLSLFLVSLISGVRVATRLCRPVDDHPPLSSILGQHPPVHVLQLRLCSKNWYVGLRSPKIIQIMYDLLKSLQEALTNVGIWCGFFIKRQSQNSIG